MWDSILKTYYQKEEVENIIQQYLKDQELGDGVVIKIMDIVDQNVYLRLSKSCTSGGPNIEKHFENLKKILGQEVPGIVHLSASVQQAFDYRVLEVSKNNETK